MEVFGSKIPKIPKLTPAKGDIKPPVQSTNKLTLPKNKTSAKSFENKPPSAGTKRRIEDLTAVEKKRLKTDAPLTSNFRSLQKNISGTTLNNGGFSESAKKRILRPQRSLNSIRESAPPSVSSSAATSSSSENTFKKPKRPVWDLKGRIQDLEALTQSLQREKEFSQQRISSLEEVRKVLDEDVHEKAVLSQEATARIDSLEKQLKEKSEEFDLVVKEKNLKLQELQAQNESLSSTNVILNTKVLSLEPLVTSLTASQATIQAELNATKILLSDTQAAKKRHEATIEKLTQENAKLEIRIRENETLRRDLHNTIQELKGNIRVFCRIRPPLASEIKKNLSMATINISPDNKSLEIGHLSEHGSSGISKSKNFHDFSFDLIFGQKSTQSYVFHEISQLVQSALDGYHVCIFAYGQTGSGKTYTMEGPEDLNDFTISTDPHLGMIPRSIHQIFHSIEDLKEKGWMYKVETSFMEIYNENIRDMLVDNSQNSALKCEIKRTASKGNDCYISNVTTVVVNTANEVSDLLIKARANRSVAATKCNERSSRSHYIFQMKLLGENKFTEEKCEGVLNLIDLAGSERVKESGSAGERFTEAKNINKSLSNLGNVIMALSQKAEHIPYRNSKLTHLLMNSLGGHSKTLMFVNISPCEDHFNETVNSLRFATKVNQCNIGSAQRRYKI